MATDVITLNPVPKIKVGTTPTITVHLPDTVDMSAILNFYLSIDQSPVLLEKSGMDISIDGHAVAASFTQADTLKLSAGTAIIELTWTYGGSLRTGSKRYYVQVIGTSIKRVLQ